MELLATRGPRRSLRIEWLWYNAPALAAGQALWYRLVLFGEEDYYRQGFLPDGYRIIVRRGRGDTKRTSQYKRAHPQQSYVLFRDGGCHTKRWPRNPHDNHSRANLATVSGGGSDKINQWKEVMGSLQEFKAYMFVKQGSCFATVMHSPMKFAAISAATGHLQGRIIGFVGDRTSTREPTPILLPQQKTWEWVKDTVNTDGPALIKHYADNPSRIGTLWKGEGGDEDTQAELHTPRLIVIPLWLLNRIRQEGRALMPYEILHIVITHLEANNTAVYADAWATIAD